MVPVLREVDDRAPIPSGVWGAELALGFGLLVLAAVLGPNSCSGGLEAYLLAGLASAVGGAAIPVAAARKAGTAVWVSLAVGAPVVLLAIWLLGFVAAEFRILCRLF